MKLGGEERREVSTETQQGNTLCSLRELTHIDVGG